MDTKLSGLDNLYTGHKHSQVDTPSSFELIRHDITEPIRLADQIHHWFVRFP